MALPAPPVSAATKRALKMPSSRDILIQTNAPEAALNFYKEVLDFQPLGPEAGMPGVETGAFRLFIDTGPALAPVLEFTVPNVQATKSRILAAGGTVVREEPEVPRCYMRDPFGLVFNIRQREPSRA